MRYDIEMLMGQVNVRCCEQFFAQTVRFGALSWKKGTRRLDRWHADLSWGCAEDGMGRAGRMTVWAAPVAEQPVAWIARGSELGARLEGVGVVFFWRGGFGFRAAGGKKARQEATARKDRKEGRREGRKEGRREGRKEGWRREGRKEGRKGPYFCSNLRWKHWQQRYFLLKH